MFFFAADTSTQSRKEKKKKAKPTDTWTKNGQESTQPLIHGIKDAVKKKKIHIGDPLRKWKWKGKKKKREPTG